MTPPVHAVLREKAEGSSALQIPNVDDGRSATEWQTIDSAPMNTWVRVKDERHGCTFERVKQVEPRRGTGPFWTVGHLVKAWVYFDKDGRAIRHGNGKAATPTHWSPILSEGAGE